MIKKIALLSAMLLAMNTYAGFEGPGATTTVVTVEITRKMPDDAKVTLEGNLVKQISEEHYLFKDATGEIEVEIDDEDFRGATVTPKNKIRIIGEVDKNWNNVKIEVDYLEVLEPDEQ